MLKKWIKRVLPGRSRQSESSGLRHKASFQLNSFAAEKVLTRLHQAGFEAYIVGGAVRDLLLGVEPKDFDISTNATPEQVRKVFRRSRIIGRRFQIVHVMIGPETIEVTTFRSGDSVSQNASGRIMSDNAYGGSLEQDAARRDFTCNALYYDFRAGEIIDFHHGIADLQARRLRMIGNAAERYQEDPVRILRAVRLSGKLGFIVEEQTAAPICHYSSLLKQEPVARLFDELMKILFCGHAAACLKQLVTLGIQGNLHPLLSAMVACAQNNGHNIGSLALVQTDQRLRAEKSVSVGFVLAAILWEDVERRWQNAIKQQNLSPSAAMSAAITHLREQMERGWGVPQRFSATMREIWILQPQFAHCRGARPYRLLAQPRFRAAYDFLLLRAQIQPAERHLADWWTAFQHADDNIRQSMTQNPPRATIETDMPVKRKRRRKPRHRSVPSHSSASE